MRYTGEVNLGDELTVLGAELSDAVVRAITGHCRGAADRGVGGVLWGRYSEDSKTCHVETADVVMVTGCEGISGIEVPPDTVALLAVGYWPDSYFVGHWHYHADGLTDLHAIDVESILETARDPGSQCLTPIHVLAYREFLPGRPDELAIGIRVFVATATQDGYMAHVAPMKQVGG